MKLMKKQLTLLTVSALLLSGCGNAPKETTTAAATTAETTTAKTVEDKPAETTTAETTEEQTEPDEPDEPEKSELDGYNILFVTVDQEHYFSEYPEGSSYKARELLAQLGTTFEKHYNCSNMSTSSRSVMFTGRHITDTNMIDNTDFKWQGAMSDELTTVGDMMNAAGYYSALKGKWHLGDASIINGGSELTSLDDYGFSDWGGKDYIGEVKEGNAIDPAIVSEATDWLSTTGKQLNEDGKPFFLTVNMVNPHDIMNYDNTGYQSDFMTLSDKPDDELYNKTYDVPVEPTWNYNYTGEDCPGALQLYQEHWGLFTGIYTDEAVWQDYQNYYFNCIQDSDNNLMVLLEYLQENGFLDNTVIVFTADHGEMHGSHGLKGKGGFFYENNVHVPLIIVHPDYEGGKTVSALTSHVDLAPTFVDIANISDEQKAEITAGLPGKSLLPLMNGSADSVRDAALYCYEMLSMTALQYGIAEGGGWTYSFDLDARGMVRAIATDKYKFVRYFKPLEFNTPETLEDLYAYNDVQLFDLEADPNEVVNLAADPETNGELIMELNAIMNKTIAEEIGVDDGARVKLVLKGIKEMVESQQNAAENTEEQPAENSEAQNEG